MSRALLDRTGCCWVLSGTKVVAFQQLLSLSHNAHQWSFPLIPPTAEQVVAGLLTENSERRRALFQEAATGDPALTLWAVCQMPDAPIPGLEDVAVWLSECAFVVSSDAVDTSQRLTEKNQVWSELAHESLNLAAQVTATSKISRTLGRRDHGRCRLLALLLNAPAWLSNSGPRVTVTPRGGHRSCLPRWLVRQIRAVRSDKGSDPIAGIVGEAVRQNQRRQRKRVPAKSIAVTAWQKVGGTEQIEAVERLRVLTDKLARLKQLEQDFTTVLREEKVAALKEFAYGASHELNNPLANISSRAQTLLRDEDDPERCRRLASINTQAYRAHEMISDLMLFAKPPALRLREIDLGEILERVLADLSDAAQQQGTELRMAGNGPLPTIQVDADHLAVALSSICRNALEALVRGGQITVEGQVLPAAEGWPLPGGQADQVCITIADDGPGVAPDIRQHLFDPYFSGREAGRGLGLGLCKAWRVIHEHGGLIQLDSDAVSGATFRISLPLRPGIEPLQQAS
ncbi:MAG: HAMP domain-containing sensor histidine kinase [Planctomycetota bacterium]|nr:HAMP domain-containing sensor histidine kinase [Planctomycetota bacterium]